MRQSERNGGPYRNIRTDKLLAVLVTLCGVVGVARAADYYWGTGAYTVQNPPFPAGLGASDMLYITNAPPADPPWFDTTVANAGLIQWVGGNLHYSSAGLNNHGVFLANSGDGLMGYRGIGGGSWFVNHADGVFRKTTLATTTVRWANAY